MALNWAAIVLKRGRGGEIREEERGRGRLEIRKSRGCDPIPTPCARPPDRGLERATTRACPPFGAGQEPHVPGPFNDPIMGSPANNPLNTVYLMMEAERRTRNKGSAAFDENSVQYDMTRPKPEENSTSLGTCGLAGEDPCSVTKPLSHLTSFRSKATAWD